MSHYGVLPSANVAPGGAPYQSEKQVTGRRQSRLPGMGESRG